MPAMLTLCVLASALFLVPTGDDKPAGKCHGCGLPVTTTEVMREGHTYKLVPAYVLMDVNTHEEWYVGYPFDTMPRDKRFRIVNGKVVVND